MILTIDIGNRTMLLGGFEGDRLVFTGRCSSDPGRTEDEYALLLRDILTMYGVTPDQVEGGILSSVVPSLREVVLRAAERLTGARFLAVGVGRLKTGLNIRIDAPTELGSDMVVNAVAALEKYTLPIAVFDLETATTLSVLDEMGAYVGGAIMPGLRVSVDAMSDAAAQLPRITLTPPSHLINASTVSCMQSGAVYGWAAMIDGLAARVEEELMAAVTVVLTGSACPLVAPYCRRKCRVDDTLRLDGLRILYGKNQPRSRSQRG